MKNFLLIGTFLLFTTMLWAQTTITGRITVGSGAGLAGASLIIKGSSEGGATDLDGNYRLTSKRPLPWRVEISYSGFRRQTFFVDSPGDQGTYLLSGQDAITGTITDINGFGLAGALVVIKGTNEGAVADIDGDYKISSVRALPWLLEVSYLGYLTEEVLVTDQGPQGKITLKEGITIGEEVVVTASRTSEKVVEAVASVTTLNDQLIAATPVNTDPSELIRSVQGVNLVRGGTQFSNFELRGAVSVSESNTLVLRDFAPITTVVDKRLNTANSALSTLDIDRIEVVRGPAGALYGPNVTSGVVHYFTKDAFKYPGLDILLGAGNQDFMTGGFRYAGNDGKRIGWKLLGTYRQSKDFAVTGNELLSNNGTPVVVPQSFHTLSGKRFEDVANLDQKLMNWSLEGGLEYFMTSKLRFNYVFGFSRAITNYRSNINHVFNGVQRYEQQLRINAGQLFVSLFHRHEYGNTDNNGNVLNTADHVFAFGYNDAINFDSDGDGEVDSQLDDAVVPIDYYDLAAQYSFNINDSFNIIVGVDAKLSPNTTNALVYGINSRDQGGDNTYNIIGGYLSGKYELTNQFGLNFAGRVDHYSAYDKIAFSPRVGLVFNPTENHGLKFSYSRSFEAISKFRSWADFVVPAPVFFPDAHVAGVAREVTYNEPLTRFAFGDVIGGDEFQLQDIVNALAAAAGVDAPTVNGAVVTPGLRAASVFGPYLGSPAGALSTLAAAGQGTPELKSVNQVELGYEGNVNRKLKLNLDLYYTIISNLQPAGAVPVSAGAQLDLPTVQALIEGQVPAGPDRDAMIEALYSTASNPTPNPDFDGVPGYGLIISDLAQANGWAFDLGYPTYGNENVEYLGLDASVLYVINSELNAYVNYSFVSDNIWTPEDLGETNANFDFFLNIPTHRVNLGLSYLPQLGLYGTLAMNHQSEYEGKQGDGNIFTGLNKARTIFDAKIGYRLRMPNSDAKVDIGLSINNVFDNKYSYFRNLPTLRRFSSLNLLFQL